MKIKEVVFPIDFSERSVEASPYVAAVTRRLGTRLTLLHVVESLPPGSSPLDRLYPGDEVELEKRKECAYRALSAFQQQYIPHVPSEVWVLVGDPAQCIVTYGGETKGRMVLMPTRGFGPFRQMLLGSVTTKVLHDSHQLKYLDRGQPDHSPCAIRHMAQVRLRQMTQLFSEHLVDGIGPATAG